MKVLFLVTEMNYPNKMGPFIYAQAQSLKHKGVDVKFFYIKGKTPLKYIISIFKLKRYLIKNSFDIIHAHYGFNAWVATFQKKIPVVVSYMGADLYVNSFIIKLINKRVTQKASYTICKSNELLQILYKQYGKIQAEVIPNGVDFNLFYPIDKTKAREKLNLSNSKKIVLFASNPKREDKNFSLAKKAFSLLDTKKYQLLTVFNKPQNILNIYYNAADVLLLTSPKEGSPNVIKEALACNLHVVSTKVGDVHEIIKDFPFSFTCNPEEAEIANKIEIASNAETYNYREKIKHLDINIIAEKIIKLYKKII